MRVTCIKCGDTFTVSKEALNLIDEGFISEDIINVCDDCFVEDNVTIQDYDTFSDADSGL